MTPPTSDTLKRRKDAMRVAFQHSPLIMDHNRSQQNGLRMSPKSSFQTQMEYQPENYQPLPVSQYRYVQQTHQALLSSTNCY